MLVKFKSKIIMKNLCINTVVEINNLLDGALKASLTSVPDVSFDVDCSTKIGSLPINIEKHIKKVLKERIDKFSQKKLCIISRLVTSPTLGAALPDPAPPPSWSIP